MSDGAWYLSPPAVENGRFYHDLPAKKDRTTEVTEVAEYQRADYRPFCLLSLNWSRNSKLGKTPHHPLASSMPVNPSPSLSQQPPST